MCLVFTFDYLLRNSLAHMCLIYQVELSTGKYQIFEKNNKNGTVFIYIYKSISNVVGTL